MTSGQSPPSSPRGLSGFCFAPSSHRTLSVLSVQSVQSVVKEEKAIRGKNKKSSSGVLLSGQNIQCFILPIVLLLLPYGKIRLL